MKKSKFRNVWFQTRNFLEHSFNVKIEIRFPNDTRIMYGHIDQIKLTKFTNPNYGMKIDNLAIVKTPEIKEDLGEITQCTLPLWWKESIIFPVILTIGDMKFNLKHYKVEQVVEIFKKYGVSCIYEK